MSDQPALEPFPSIVPSAYHLVQREPQKPQSNEIRLRRKSSSLHGEPRGDATGPALATVFHSSKRTSDRPRRSKRRKLKSLFKRWKTLSLRHTWVNPLFICLIVIVLNLANPSPSNPFHAALFLSYPIPRQPNDDPSTPIQYGKGSRDFAFVAFYTIFLSFTREFIMQRFLRPLARSLGIHSRAKQARFMEQAYTALYFAIFAPFGLYVMYRSPLWYFRTLPMYETFPDRQHEGLFKAYYLLQASYWTQQMIVLLLMLEKPRKDFKELVAHHIITLALIWLSYRFHFTHMGIAVYITHDISDFFLATSKILNYIDSPIVIPYFCVFLSAWVYLRHYINLRILLSLLPLPSPFPDHITAQLHTFLPNATALLAKPLLPFLNLASNLAPNATNALTTAVGALEIIQLAPNSTQSSQFATVGPYELNWETQQYKCWISQWITFGLLAALQSVNIFWLVLILRILWRVIKTLGQVREDERSEYDSEDEEEEQMRREELRMGKEIDEAMRVSEGEEVVPEVLVNGEPVGRGNGVEVKKR